VNAASPVTVRPATDADLGAVAVLHVAAFPESVLGQLGTEAVRRNYVWQLHGPHDVTAIVADLDGRTVGFLFGGVFRGSTIGFVKSQKFFLAGQVLRHPRVLLDRIGWDRIRLATRLVTSRWSTPAPEVPAAVPRSSFGVLAIAVDPTVQGHGVGRMLMGSAEAAARAAGFDAMHLSVHPENHQAVSFYESLGWRRAPEDDGTWAGRMRISLTGEPVADPA
jgi:ribosomal protein S18 acetylase RimI-like enzyme